MRLAGYALILLSAVSALFGAACPPKIQPGDPLPGLSRDERARFEKGRNVFERKFTPETGLGPLFNADACGECHEEPVPGGMGDEVEIHVAALRPDGVCDPLVAQGGFVIQQHATPALQAALGIVQGPISLEATARAQRSTPHP